MIKKTSIPNITISFREKEKFIYDEILKHSGYSNWIKDILKEHISDSSTASTKQKCDPESQERI